VYPAQGDELWAKLYQSTNRLLIHWLVSPPKSKNIVRKAIDAGEALLDVKRQVGHGNFRRWVKDNCAISERTAEVYMECWRNRQKAECHNRRDCEYDARRGPAENQGQV